MAFASSSVRLFVRLVRDHNSKIKRRKKRNWLNVTQLVKISRCANFHFKKSKIRKTAAQYAGSQHRVDVC